MPSIKIQLKSDKDKKLKDKKEKKNLKPSKRLVIESVVLVAFAAISILAYSLYADKKDLENQLATLQNNPQQAVQQQTQSLISSVGNLITLPKGETPTVAAVTNAAQAKQQSAFFNDAQNGDKVLLYVKAGQAILYRPSTKKIVIVAPLTFSTGAANGTTTDTTSTKR